MLLSRLYIAKKKIMTRTVGSDTEFDDNIYGANNYNDNYYIKNNNSIQTTTQTTSSLNGSSGRKSKF